MKVLTLDEFCEYTKKEMVKERAKHYGFAVGDIVRGKGFYLPKHGQIYGFPKNDIATIVDKGNSFNVKLKDVILISDTFGEGKLEYTKLRTGLYDFLYRIWFKICFRSSIFWKLRRKVI